jgi:hypothetical protein
MRVSIFAASLFWAATATAQTGSQLQEGFNSQNGWGEGFSKGYASGVVATAKIFITSGRWACIPAGVGNAQIWAVVEKYLKDHPEKLHEMALQTVLQATHDAWPCDSK